MNQILSFFCVLLISILTVIFSLAGGFLLLENKKSAKFLKRYGAFIAIFFLIYAIFCDLLPEIFESNSLTNFEILQYIFLGIFLCFFFGLFAGHFHHHGSSSPLKSHEAAISMLAIDTLHSALDGLTLGLAFASSLSVGLTTALAIVAHELPQEIGDFSIMLRSHISIPKIKKYQFLSGLSLVPASIISYFIGINFSDILPRLLCFIVGSFCYIIWLELHPYLKKLLRKLKISTPKTIN